LTDPYETLGVPRDAPPDEIRRTYRAKAKKAHPDAGGKSIAMAELSEAYAILISPERREQYDETGQTEKKDIAAAAMNKAAQAALQILLEHEQDSPKRMIDEYEKSWARTYKQKKAELQAQQEQLERAEKRLIKRPAFDIIGQLLANQGRAAEREMRKLEEDNEVLRILREYEFEEPPETVVVYTPTGYVTMNLGRGFSA
jgi:curved DNA-binding protein CbpA